MTNQVGSGSPSAAPQLALRLAARGAAAATRALGASRYLLMDMVGLATYAAQRDRRERTIRNHMRATGVDRAGAQRLARRSFCEYGRTAIDVVWTTGATPARVQRRSTFIGRHYLDALQQRGQGAILALCHFGSWDMAATVALADGISITTVMGDIGKPWMTELVAWSRAGQAMELFTLKDAARGLLRALRAGRLVALLCDIPEHGPTTEVEFCRGPVRFSMVPARLALRTGAPLIPAECWRGRDGYIVRVHPAITITTGDTAQEVMQRVATVLEQAVQRVPSQWYPFHEVYTDQS